jgi:hypothetical protein
LRLEELEPRTVLTVFTPTQITHAYGIDKLGLDGTNQTIAIVDAFDDPTIAGDLATFNSTYGLAPATLNKVDQTGGVNYPALDTGWALEIALDVEWAHAVAPKATILLVEANSNSYSDLLAAVDYASAHASVVSMSWGGGEFSAETSSSYDGHFSNHPGVTFVAASGDSGKPPEWPAVSPNVVAVGGTTLTLNADNTWKSETGWGNGSLSRFFGGSGGGISTYETQPSYQKGVVTQSTTKRTNPDVAYDANPNTGFDVYDTNNGGLLAVGGTSAGSPQWAGLIALANQSRAASGKGTLSSTDTLSALYTAPTSDFHDITSGNNGYAAKVGYDLVTGIGTPKADLIVPMLASATSSAAVVKSSASNTVTGTATGTTGHAKGNVLLSGPGAAPAGDSAADAAVRQAAQVLVAPAAYVAAPTVVATTALPAAVLPPAPAVERAVPAATSGPLSGGGGDSAAVPLGAGPAAGELLPPAQLPSPGPSLPAGADTGIDTEVGPGAALTPARASDACFTAAGWQALPPAGGTLPAFAKESGAAPSLAAALAALGAFLGNIQAAEGAEAEKRRRPSAV